MQKIFRLILLSSLLLPLSSKLQAELFSFCFDKNQSLQSVHYYLNEILLSRDKVYYRESKNCLELDLSPARKELVEKFLSKRYPDMSVYGDATISSNLDYQKTCNIQVIKKGQANKQQENYQIGKRNKAVMVTSKENESSVMEMTVTQGLRGKLQMDEDELEIICREIGTKYQIEIFVVVTKENQTSQVSTNLLVDRGVATDIGSIVKDLKNKDKKISSDEGFEKNKVEGESQTTLSIVIK